VGYPRVTGLDSLFDRALSAARQLGASDVHLKPGLAPILRIDGELRTLRDVPPLSPDFLHSLALSLLNDRRREILERAGDVTLALGTGAGLRQRIHIVQQRGGIGLSMRLIPAEVPTLAALGLPPQMSDLTARGAGLVVISGAAGHGKSTTLAALIDALGQERPCRVMTIEDPVEIMLKDRRSVVIQREVGTDMPSAAAGLRAAIRQDIDVLALSDVGDRETFELALSAADSGRLVMVGVSAGGIGNAILRLAALSPLEARGAARSRIAAVLRGIVFQRLVPARDGRGRALAGELLRAGAEARRLLAAWDGETPFDTTGVPGISTFEHGARRQRRQAADDESEAVVEDDGPAD
jgi:twitching motility protein PilT